MAEYFGWWDYQSSPPAMSNRFTGQRVACQKVAGATPLPRHALGFLYSDREIEFPIVVRTSLQGRGPYRGHPYLQSTWEVDYELSAEIWRETSKAADTYPGYGVWVRIDDCVIDALSCWPEHDHRISGHVIKSSGGWFGGQWLSSLKREHSGVARAEKKRQEILAECHFGHAQPPPDVPDLVEPPRWHFVDAEIASVKIELDHIDHSRGFPYLSSANPLSGFEGVPHLLRDDGAAVYFPSYVTTHFHRGEDCHLDASFTYADEHVVLTLRESESFGARFQPMLCGVRSPEKAADYEPFQRGVIHAHLRPVLLPYWRRACRVLSEIRFLWQGPERRMRVAPELWVQDQRSFGSHARFPAPSYKFRPPYTFALYGGFIAGIPSWHWSIKIAP